MQCSSGRLLFWSLKSFLECLTCIENLHPINFIFKSLSWTARVCLVCVIVKEGFWKGMFSCYISSLFKTPLYLLKLSLVLQFSSVVQLCLNLCDPMNHSTPVLPVHHRLPEFTQTHVHRVGDAIQPSHSLSSPSLPAPNPSQHQSLLHVYKPEKTICK